MSAATNCSPSWPSHVDQHGRVQRLLMRRPHDMSLLTRPCCVFPLWYVSATFPCMGERALTFAEHSPIANLHRYGVSPSSCHAALRHGASSTRCPIGARLTRMAPREYECGERQDNACGVLCAEHLRPSSGGTLCALSAAYARGAHGDAALWALLVPANVVHNCDGEQSRTR